MTTDELKTENQKLRAKVEYLRAMIEKIAAPLERGVVTYIPYHSPRWRDAFFNLVSVANAARAEMGWEEDPDTARRRSVYQMLSRTERDVRVLIEEASKREFVREDGFRAPTEARD